MKCLIDVGANMQHFGYNWSEIHFVWKSSLSLFIALCFTDTSLPWVLLRGNNYKSDVSKNGSGEMCLWTDELNIASECSGWKDYSVYLFCQVQLRK